MPLPKDLLQEAVDYLANGIDWRTNRAKELGFGSRESYQRSMRRERIKLLVPASGIVPLEAPSPKDSGGWEATAINVPLKIETGNEPKTAAIINDLQIPYYDAKVLELVENFLAEILPDFLFYNGDIHDFYEISDFDKNPSRINRMQDELDFTRAILGKHKVLLPNTERKLILGNHEDRLRRFLWKKAPELATLRCLTIEELLGLKENEIELIAYEQGMMINDVFLILHGNIASVHSGYTAKRMYEKHGGCGICGHCHRLGSYFKKDRFGIWGWWENGCICHLNPDWIKNPNWVQGFSLVHFQDDRFWVEQIPIINEKFMYAGRIYG
jgi:hypothetical protein